MKNSRTNLEVNLFHQITGLTRIIDKGIEDQNDYRDKQQKKRRITPNNLKGQEQ